MFIQTGIKAVIWLVLNNCRALLFVGNFGVLSCFDCSSELCSSFDKTYTNGKIHKLTKIGVSSDVRFHSV